MVSFLDEMVLISGFTPEFRRSEANLTAQRPYISHYPYCELAGKLVRKQTYIPKNVLEKGKKATKDYIAQILATVDDKLSKGFVLPSPTPILPRVPQSGSNGPANGVTLVDAIGQFMRQKRHDVSFIKNLEIFFEGQMVPYVQKMWPNILVGDFTRAQVAQMLSDLQIERDWKARTRNFRKDMLHNFFEFCIEREMLEHNHAKRLARQKEKYTEHFMPFMPEQAAQLEAHLKAHDPQMYLFTRFIYYTFLRPWNELRKAKISHLDMKNRVLFIPSENAKSRQSDYVFLPEKLVELIHEYKLLSYPASSYIFSPEGKPGKKLMVVNTMRERHRRMLRMYGLDGTHHLYSWKPTGVCAMYRKCKDIKAVQRQCRHADIQTTDIYLNHLGLYKEMYRVDFE